jgi:TPR repeat protein
MAWGGLLIPIVLAIGAAPHAAAAGKTDPWFEQALQEQRTASLDRLFGLYARSAEQGNAVAQYNVAMMYANGEAVNVDYQQAAYWFGKSAQQALPAAQYRLGEMYYFGRGGLERNLKKAFDLFEKASENGDTDAQVNLAMMLAAADGVPLDTGRALHWLSRAVDGGHAAAPEYYQLLRTSPGGRVTEAQRSAYWDQQRTFWIEEAAEYGVREAEETSAWDPHSVRTRTGRRAEGDAAVTRFEKFRPARRWRRWASDSTRWFRPDP